jgi:hypothetical protein
MAAMARRRRKRWLALLLLLALLAVLLGRGLGLFPSPGRTTGTSLPAPAQDQRTEARTSSDDQENGNGVQSDQLHSLRSTMTAASRAGRIGAAYAALASLQQAALPQPQLLAARAQLDADLEQALRALAEEFEQGRVLAARQRLRLLLQDGSAEVRTALDRCCTAHSWPAFAAPAPRAAVPSPEPLPRDLLLRSDRQGTVFSGRVVDARAGEVTVRVADSTGVTFPTLPLTEVEPVHPNAVLAAELGLAALRAGDALLARCWLACGLAFAHPPVRLQELAVLLR